MKKVLLTVLLVATAFVAKAQNAPGIYSVIDGKATPLKFETAYINAPDDIDHDTDLFDTMSRYYYKGKTAAVASKGEFELVVDPEKKAFLQTPRRYFVFIGNLTPDNMLLIPLELKKNRRLYDCRKAEVHGLVVNWVNVPFTWEKTGENTFRIKADLAPGEYAFAFRFTEKSKFNFQAVYTFTVPE